MTRVTPLGGPLAQDPTTDVYRLASGSWGARNVGLADVRTHLTAMMADSLEGIDLGTWDRQILAWLDRHDTSVVATIASLLWRARHADSQHLHQQISDLRAEVDTLRAELAHAPAPEDAQ